MGLFESIVTGMNLAIAMAIPLLIILFIVYLGKIAGKNTARMEQLEKRIDILENQNSPLQK